MLGPIGADSLGWPQGAICRSGHPDGVFKKIIMNFVNRRTRVFVCKEPTDMRMSFSGLFQRVKEHMKADPFEGHLYVFLNKTRSTCKALLFDGTGLVVISKKLEQGAFSAVNPFLDGEIVLTQAEFALFFEGADLTKRFIDSPKEQIKRKKGQAD
jgi:transposase